MRPLSSWDRFRQEGVSVLRCQHRLPAVIHTAALESAPSELPRAPQGSPALLQSLHERSLPLLPSQTHPPPSVPNHFQMGNALSALGPEQLNSRSGAGADPAQLNARSAASARPRGGTEVGSGEAAGSGSCWAERKRASHIQHTHTDTGKERSGCLEVVGTGSAGQSNGMGSLPRSSELPRRAALQFRAFLAGGHTRTRVAAQQNQQFPTLQP